MTSKLIFATAVVAALTLSTSAFAFDCPNRFTAAEAAIESATKAMKAMPDGTNKGLVHSLIDDAKALLQSGRHNHAKPAAGGFDHARAVAKANSAAAYAEAAGILAGKS